MDFNNSTTTNSGVTVMNRICQTGNNTYSLADKASDANKGLDRFWFLSMMADGKWQLDDSNNSDLPTATTTLNANQIDYSLSSDMLMIEKILVKDESGNWSELLPVDVAQSQTDVHAQSLVQRPTGNTGIPTHYDVSGTTIYLDPIPSYTQAASLKVMFKRGPSYFVSTDTTKTPGIPSIFHLYPFRYGALQFLIDKGNPKKNDLAVQVQQDEEAITEFYSKRNKNEPQQITTKYRSSR